MKTISKLVQNKNESRHSFLIRLRHQAEMIERERRKSQYERHDIISVTEGINRIILARDKPYTHTLQIIRGVEVYCGGRRIKTFLKGISCVNCKIQGIYFAIERTSPYDPRYHLNLYAKKSGQMMLMTSDHIQPKSLKGSDRLENRQPMCLSCNLRKGNEWKPQKENYTTT